MKFHPILFSGPMVRAILEGRKTQTRRMMKPQPYRSGTGTWFWSPNKNVHHVGDDGMFQFVVSSMSCPYGRPGDRLWVRETFAPNLVLPLSDREPGDFIYRADLQGGVTKYSAQWKPSIFCTRAASRITLEIVAVRVERLNDITEADAMAEGPTPSIVGADLDHIKWRAGYATLWEIINGAGSWDKNPWVWVIEFKRI